MSTTTPASSAAKEAPGNSKAMARWRLLAAVIRKSEAGADQAFSVRRHQGFNLYKRKRLDADSVKELESTHSLEESAVVFDYHQYTPVADESVSVVLRQQVEGGVTLDQLANVDGVDNTGNVCIWPSEENLADYCLKHPDILKGKRVLELGGGATCLAGITLGVAFKLQSLVLTDGHAEAVKTLQSNVDMNAAKLQCTALARKLIWDRSVSDFSHLSEDGTSQPLFDTILVADCLFFDKYHEDLIHVLDSLLSSDGVVLVMGPKRGKSYGMFLDKLAAGSAALTPRETEEYDETIFAAHKKEVASNAAYDADIHFPLLLELTRPSS